MTTATKKPQADHRPKVSITLPPSLLDRVDEHAKELETTRSYVIALAIRAFFEGS